MRCTLGCDGLRSPVRKVCMPGAASPDFQGMVTLRGRIATHALQQLPSWRDVISRQYMVGAGHHAMVYSATDDITVWVITVPYSTIQVSVPHCCATGPMGLRYFLDMALLRCSVSHSWHRRPHQAWQPGAPAHPPPMMHRSAALRTSRTAPRPSRPSAAAVGKAVRQQSLQSHRGQASTTRRARWRRRPSWQKSLRQACCRCAAGPGVTETRQGLSCQSAAACLNRCYLQMAATTLLCKGGLDLATMTAAAATSVLARDRPFHHSLRLRPPQRRVLLNAPPLHAVHR